MLTSDISASSVEVLQFSVFLAVLGLLVGSFLNVIIYRLPVMMMRDWRKQASELLNLPPPEHDQDIFNLALPNSRCPCCHHKIKPWENIPVVSWLFLRGRCSSCKQPISVRYPIVELACGILSGVVAWQFGFGLQAFAFVLLTWGLLALSLIDADHQLLPDVLVLPLLWLGLIVNYYGLFASLNDALWGAVIGYMSLWLLYWAFKLIRGKEGMGYGDFKLFAVAGAWGGWQVLPTTITIAAFVGLVVSVVLLFCQRNGFDKPIPFGPYLALAMWIAIIGAESVQF